MKHSPLVNQAYETLKPYVPGKPISETERELNITGCIKLASNENPLGPSPMALVAIQQGLSSLAEYPDGSAFYLKEKLAQKHGVTSRQIILGNGTNELIELLIRTCICPSETMLYGSQSFLIYKLCAEAAGVPIVTVPFQNGRLDLDGFLRAANSHTKLVFIDNPNNPTGTYIPRDEMRTFLQRLPEHIIVVLDEAYFEYKQAEDYPDGLTLLAERERLLILRTFSKCYGLAGLRVGYGIGETQLVEYLNRARQPFNVNSLAQLGALAALDDKAHVEAAVSLNRKEMGRMIQAYRTLGFAVKESQANFLLVDFGRNAEEVFERLLRLSVIIRPVGAYGLPNAARITIGTPLQNDKLIGALKQVFPWR